jgi:hypothetical protein
MFRRAGANICTLQMRQRTRRRFMSKLGAK